MSAKKTLKTNRSKKTRALVPRPKKTDAIGPAGAPGVVEARIANWLQLFEPYEGGKVVAERDDKPLFFRPVSKTVGLVSQACAIWNEVVNGLQASSFQGPGPSGRSPTVVTLAFHDRRGQMHGTLMLPIFRHVPSAQPADEVGSAHDLSGGAFATSAMGADEARLDRAAIVHHLHGRAQKLMAATGPGRGSPADRAIRLIQADVLQDAARVIQEGRYLP